MHLVQQRTWESGEQGEEDVDEELGAAAPFVVHGDGRDEQREEEQQQLKRKQELERKQRELPQPPAADAKDTTSVVVRLPNGNRLMRKFNKTDLLRHVYDFVDLSSELQPGSYHLVSSYPRQVYANQERTLGEAGLVPQAALLIEDV